MIEIKHISGSLGVELTGVDLAKKLSQKTCDEIRLLLLEHEVIFFREQNISPMQLQIFAEIFGSLKSRHEAFATVKGYPQINKIESTPAKPTKIELWHTDMTFLSHPPLGSVLQAKVVPPKGGDTLWSSMTAAYDGLSEPMKKFLSSLKAEHSFAFGFKETLSEPGAKDKFSKALSNYAPTIHPVVFSHPVSKKKALFVNSLFTTHILGLSSSESDALLSFLYEHARKPEYTCRFSWEENSIAVWDNLSTQHKPINDYFPHSRKLRRVTISGQDLLEHPDGGS